MFQSENSKQPKILRMRPVLSRSLCRFAPFRTKRSIDRLGRQTHFHMLQSDCREFLQFVQGRDPVIVIHWTSKSQELEEVTNACANAGWYCLWNQHLLASLTRKYIRDSDRGSYYRVDSGLPVIEFSYIPNPELWNGRPALVQGRVWAGFETKNKQFERWYAAVVRWLRANFIRNPVPLLGGYLGPGAYD